LAELQGGSITAESSGIPGEGSCFTLRIVAPEAQDGPPGAVRPPSGDLAGKAVMVVGGSSTNRRILVAQLRGWGMSVREAESSEEAIETVRGGLRPAVALVDHHPPEVDGTAFAAAIVEAAGPDRLAVIVVSSIRDRDPDTGAEVAWLTKPVKPSALLDALHGALADPEGAPAEVAPPETARPMGERHPLRILLAEDNAVNQKLALRLLQQQGYTAQVAATGLQAVEALEASTFDLVLMDVQMPELDGLEATRRIRRRWPGPGGPRIVAMTANAMAGDRELCLAAGMDGYISKPIRVEELAEVLGSTPASISSRPGR
jgi:CheY-like chemotaxis protein